MSGQVGDTVKTVWVTGRDAGRTQAGQPGCCWAQHPPGCQGGPGAWRWELRWELSAPELGHLLDPSQEQGRPWEPPLSPLTPHVPTPCPRPFLPQLDRKSVV